MNCRDTTMNCFVEMLPIGVLDIAHKVKITWGVTELLRDHYEQINIIQHLCNLYKLILHDLLCKSM